MSIVKTEILTIGEFLQNKNLLIPQFQRPYKWTVRNVIQLLDDIQRFKGITPYRIGTIVIYKENETANIVDGQQRTNAIIKFIDNQYEVDGRYYNNLSEEEKSNFLKYEVAVIELDLENDDPKVQEIFQRINRTSNSLSIIEKMASEYSTAEYMLVAKLLANEIELDFDATQEDLREDPNIPKEFFVWAKKQKVKIPFSVIND